MTRSLLAVADANIWIDLDVGGLLEQAFGLGIQWLVPDVVLAELLAPASDGLVALGLESCELPPEQITEVLALGPRYPRVSTPDAFALIAARSHSAMLVTGDKHLRKAAEEQGVTCHGMLWLLDTMVDQHVVTPPTAASALRQMLDAGSRLPTDECATRLRRWRLA